MSVFVRRYLQRSRCVEALVEDWKLEFGRSMVVFDVEELVSECIELTDLGKQTWDSLWRVVFSDPNGESVEAYGRMMKAALTRTQRIFQAIQELLVDAKKKGHTIQGTADFETAVQDICDIAAKVESVYPPFDAAMAEEAIAEFKRGEYIPIEDLIREAQGLAAAAH